MFLFTIKCQNENIIIFTTCNKRYSIIYNSRCLNIVRLINYSNHYIPFMGKIIAFSNVQNQQKCLCQAEGI